MLAVLPLLFFTVNETSSFGLFVVCGCYFEVSAIARDIFFFPTPTIQSRAASNNCHD